MQSFQKLFTRGSINFKIFGHHLRILKSTAVSLPLEIKNSYNNFSTKLNLFFNPKEEFDNPVTKLEPKSKTITEMLRPVAAQYAKFLPDSPTHRNLMGLSLALTSPLCFYASIKAGDATGIYLANSFAFFGCALMCYPTLLFSCIMLTIACVLFCGTNIKNFLLKE